MFGVSITLGSIVSYCMALFLHVLVVFSTVDVPTVESTNDSTTIEITENPTTIESTENPFTSTTVSTNTTFVPISIPLIPLADSKYWDCGLSTTHDTVQLLKDRTSNRTTFLYLKLLIRDDSNLTYVDFSDTHERTLLTNKSNDDIVDPLTWIWAREGKGTNLLTCSFDFEVLSLTTLSLGVHTMDPVEIVLPSNETNCFWNATDDRKLHILARSIALLIEGTVPGTNGTAEPGDTVFKVCLERISSNPNAIYKLLLDAHILRQLSTTYDCWKIVKNSKEFGHVIYRDKITSAWLVALYVVGLVVALFFPFFLVSCFTWKHPPKEIEGRSWIALNISPLPVGMKYSLFLWQPRKHANAANTVRALVTVMILFSIQYIPVVCSLTQNPERFWAHKKALDRTGLLPVSRDYMYVLSDILFCFIPSIIFVILYNTGNDRGLFRKTLRNSISIEFHPCLIKEKSRIGDEYKSDIQVLYENMKKNIFAILNPNVWASAICSWWVFLNVPCLILSALPLSYCGLLIGKTAIWCFAYDMSGAIIALFVLATFYFFTIKIITVFIYIAQICVYTYTGIVTNADAIGPIFIVVLLDLFFVLTALNILYDKYFELLNQTVTIAEDVWRDQESPNQNGSFSINQDRSTEAPSAAESPCNGNAAGIPNSESKEVIDVMKPNCCIIGYTARQVPIIDAEFFSLVVEKYMPYRKAIFKTMLRQILPVVVVSICGLQVGYDVVITKNFYSMFNFLMSVALSGAIPAIGDIMGRNRSEVACTLEARKRDIRQFLMTFNEDQERMTDSVQFASSEDRVRDRPSTV